MGSAKIQNICPPDILIQIDARYPHFRHADFCRRIFSHKIAYLFSTEVIIMKVGKGQMNLFRSNICMRCDLIQNITGSAGKASASIMQGINQQPAIFNLIEQSGIHRVENIHLSFIV